MNLPAITVIIPCYKAAATLRRAVRSALAGAPDNLQLLLIDDGSPDETGALCDALAAEDTRVTALHRPNGGAAAARNAGLDAMRGDWVLFLDADDELLPGLWDALCAACSAAKAQPGLVLFGMERVSGPVPCPLAPGVYPAVGDLGAALGPLLFETGYLAAPYPKLFAADVIRAADLRFDEALAVNEDVRFNLDFLYFSHKTPAICCLPGVYYRQHDETAGSLSRSLRGDLLDAEARTRPALDRLLREANWPAAGRAALLRQSRVQAAINQYDLLTGRPGRMPLAARRALFGRILQDADARAALRHRLRRDPNRLAALPYRLCIRLRLPGALALYTAGKNWAVGGGTR